MKKRYCSDCKKRVKDDEYLHFEEMICTRCRDKDEFITVNHIDKDVDNKLKNMEF